MIVSSAINEPTILTAQGRLTALLRPVSALTGGLWISHYLLQLGFGLATGKVLFDAQGSGWMRLDALVFFGAYIATGVALLASAARLHGRARVAGQLGSMFAILGTVGGITGAVVGLFAAQPMPTISFAGKTILGLFIAAIVLGGTHLRQNTLPRFIGLSILLFGLLTMPLAFAFETLEHTVPSYIVTEVHFVLSGAAWFVVYALLRPKPTQDW